MKRASRKTSPVRMSLSEVRGAASQTDWQRLKDMSDNDITRAAESDPDALPLDDPFFATARRLDPSELLKPYVRTHGGKHAVG
jgi:hypothetical protein